MYIYQCYRVENISLKTWANVDRRKKKILNIIISTFRYVYICMIFVLNSRFHYNGMLLRAGMRKKNSHYYFQLSFYNVFFFYIKIHVYYTRRAIRIHKYIYLYLHYVFAFKPCIYLYLYIFFFVFILVPNICARNTIHWKI